LYEECVGFASSIRLKAPSEGGIRVKF